MSEKTICDVERAKFEGFGTYKLPIEERVNEIIEATKKEYPNVDNYLLWLCSVDYVLEEKDRACSAVVIALRFGTQGPGFEPGLFYKSMLHASSWLLNEAKSFY